MIALNIVLAAVVFIVYAVVKRPNRGSKRRKRLEAKYKGSHRLQTIVDGKITRGMSEAEVIDAWGSPARRSHRVLKTKTTETLQYGSGRYRSRVNLENGSVVGWTQGK